MKLPFVSRDRYDDATSRLDQRISALEAENKKYMRIILDHHLGHVLAHDEEIKQAIQAAEEQAIEVQSSFNLKGRTPAETARRVTTFLAQQFEKGTRAPASAVIAKAIAEGEANAEMKHSALGRAAEKIAPALNDQSTTN